VEAARKRGAKAEWVAVAHVNAGASLSDALRLIEQRDRPGFFRVIQTQRQVWAERVGGKLRLGKWHAGSPAALARTAEAFVRDRGQWPTKARARGAPERI
jgi:hypothetical protein